MTNEPRITLRELPSFAWWLTRRLARRCWRLLPAAWRVNLADALIYAPWIIGSIAFLAITGYSDPDYECSWLEAIAGTIVFHVGLFGTFALHRLTERRS